MRRSINSVRRFGIVIWLPIMVVLAVFVTRQDHVNKSTPLTAPNKIQLTQAPVYGLLNPDKPTLARVSENYGKLPLSFEANEGHKNSEVKFVSRGKGYNLV